MGYFLQHQIKDINSSLDQLLGSEKLSYLNEQLRLAEKDLKNKLPYHRRLFMIFFSKSGFKNPALFPAHYQAYSDYADERIKLTYPVFVRTFFHEIIKAAALLRYDRIIEKEKKQLIRFIKQKIETQVLIETPTAQDIPYIQTVNSSKDMEDIPVYSLDDENYFVLPDNIDYDSIKTLLNYNFTIYFQGYAAIRNIIDSLNLNRKIIELNKMKSDLARLTYAMDLTEYDLATFSYSYIIHIHNCPEILNLIKEHYEVCKAQIAENEKVTIEDIKFSLAGQRVSFLNLLSYIEKDLKIFELQRILETENAGQKVKIKKNTAEQSVSQKKKKDREKIIWFGSETQLIDLFFLLRKESYLTEYDDNSILPHFDIKGEMTTDISKVLKLTSDHFFWLGADNDFALLVDELAKANLISDKNKFKLFSTHFQNSMAKPFKNLAQKHYNKKNYNNNASKIPSLVKNLLTNS